MRLDKAIVGQNLAPTRSVAQQDIAAGRVTVDGLVVTKASFPVGSGQVVAVVAGTDVFVSRGGHKLAAALEHWRISLAGRICLDVGVSTGGFTDCMLQHGAVQVIGVDSGHGQLANSLQRESRLRLLERTNARYLTAALLPESISFFTVDVSFIAASLVLPSVIASAFRSADREENAGAREAVVLVKPQFEAGREFVGKHGIVRSVAAHRRAVERVSQTLVAHGAHEIDTIESPIQGGDGNHEFLLYARF